MSTLELILIGIGLAMDAFAVSICKGLAMRKFDYKMAGILALSFGGFQALMPFLGWMLGSQFAHAIEKYDHWIAFVLLLIIGFQMLKEGLGSQDNDEISNVTSFKELMMLSIATSIDALAVGVTFSFLQVSIGFAITVIGIITFIISFAGVKIGNVFGTKYKQKAEIFGALVLMAIGTKILLQHLFF